MSNMINFAMTLLSRNPQIANNPTAITPTDTLLDAMLLRVEELVATDPTRTLI